MVDARGQAALAKKTLAHVGRIELLSEHFQGNAAPGGDLLGFVNRAHSASAEQSEQTVAAEFAGEFRRATMRKRRRQRHRDRPVSATGPVKSARHEARGAELVGRFGRNRRSAVLTFIFLGSAHESISKFCFIHFFLKETCLEVTEKIHRLRRTLTR